MNEEQRKRQRAAVQSTYRRLLKDERIERLDEDDGKSLHMWAGRQLGRIVSKITTLEDCELNALRDVLNGKPIKVAQRLRDVLSKTKRSPDGYAIHIARANYADRLADGVDYTIETLPFLVAYRILMQEETRAGGYRKGQWNSFRRTGAGTKVDSEQASLWGMQ